MELKQSIAYTVSYGLGSFSSVSSTAGDARRAPPKRPGGMGRGSITSPDLNIKLLNRTSCSAQSIRGNAWRDAGKDGRRGDGFYQLWVMVMMEEKGCGGPTAGCGLKSIIHEISYGCRI